jgi:hypothetical protein
MTTTSPDDTFDVLPEAERDELLADIGEVVYMNALHKAWESLEAEKQDELTTLVEASASDPENEEKSSAIEVYIQSNVPTWEQIIEEEIVAFGTAQSEIEKEIEEELKE